MLKQLNIIVEDGQRAYINFPSITCFIQDRKLGIKSYSEYSLSCWQLKQLASTYLKIKQFKTVLI